MIAITVISQAVLIKVGNIANGQVKVKRFGAL